MMCFGYLLSMQQINFSGQWTHHICMCLVALDDYDVCNSTSVVQVSNLGNILCVGYQAEMQQQC